nr:DsbA family protein [Actinokineospora bangkokensis]
MSSEPRFYFSLRSPYSWLALHDLVTRFPDIALTARWRPFWEPDARSAAALRDRGGDFPYAPMSRAKHLYVLQDVKRLAAERGLVPAWPVDRDPVWEVPHLAYLVAERAGASREFVAAVTAARWERGLDICDPAVVGAAAAEVGVDPTAAAGAGEDPDLRAEGVERLLDVCSDGVFGVPYFRRGRARFWGVDRLPAFAAHVRARSPQPGPDPGQPLAGGLVDGGHAGGCG